MKNEKILIIGGTGALGGTLAKRYYNNNDNMVVSRNEHKQEAMKVKYPNIIYRLGDVKDKPSLVRCLYEFKPTVVINTAAVKTVWVCQENSYESVQTNIIGHQNLIDAIQECTHKINTLVFISTDKACKPVNVYGMSKAIAEQLYVNFAKQQSSIKVVMARYGNVLNSTGSIIPLFKNKIQEGIESLPITDFGMTRFLLTLEQAIDLLVHDMNEYQSSNSYWYEHSKVNVIWSESDEAYIFLNQKNYNNKTFDYYNPSDLRDGIRNELSNEDLIDFMIADQNSVLVDFEDELEKKRGN